MTSYSVVSGRGLNVHHEDSDDHRAVIALGLETVCMPCTGRRKNCRNCEIDQHGSMSSCFGSRHAIPVGIYEYVQAFTLRAHLLSSGGFPDLRSLVATPVIAPAAGDLATVLGPLVTASENVIPPRRSKSSSDCGRAIRSTSPCVCPPQ